MSANPLLRQSREDLAELVRAELGRMSRSDVLVATLAADEDLTEPEAAEVLGCSVDEFRRRYADVIERLRAALSEAA